MGRLDGKRVLLVIASRDFRDEEYAAPRKALEEAGARVTVASSSLKPSRGMLGLVVQPDLLLPDARAADYAAVVFVGGSGAGEYWDDATAHALAKAAVAAGKVTAAICIAPVTLANAGLLAGKSATVWPECRNQLTQKGARLAEGAVVCDGPLITGNGPPAAAEFGTALVNALGGTSA
jgi:protease I